VQVSVRAVGKDDSLLQDAGIDAMMYQHTLLATKSKRKMSEVDRIEMEKD
jgi:hypothetical protein